MGKSFQCCSAEDVSFAISPGEVCYSPITMCYGDDGFSSAEEIQTQATYRGGGRIGGLSVLVSANSFSTASLTIVTRKNTADGNQSITVAAGLTGIFSDNTNIDTLADGDLYNVKITGAAGGTGNAQIRYIGAWRFDNVNHRIQYGVTEDGLVSFVASTDYFIHLAGNIGLETVENSVKAQVDIDGTLTNLQVGVITNSRSSSTVVKSRVNNADGNQSVTITAGSTGIFEDTTHTDTLAAGDDINYKVSMGTGTGTFGVRYINSTKQNTNANKSNVYSSVALGRFKLPGLTLQSTIAGLIQSNSLAENIVNQNTNFNFVATKLKAYISANTNTSASTIVLRKNGANGNNTLNITALTTGLFEDTTHSDAVLGTDEVNYQWSGGGTGSATAHWIGMLMESEAMEKFTGGII